MHCLPRSPIPEWQHVQPVAGHGFVRHDRHAVPVWGRKLGALQGERGQRAYPVRTQGGVQAGEVVRTQQAGEHVLNLRVKEPLA